MAEVMEVRGLHYNTVAASQTAQTLIGTVNTSTGAGKGATNDILEYLVIMPATTSPGAVTLGDGATTITPFAGGANSVGDLKPFVWVCGSRSQLGAWKVTTGTNVSVLAAGRFT